RPVRWRFCRNVPACAAIHRNTEGTGDSLQKARLALCAKCAAWLRCIHGTPTDRPRLHDLRLHPVEDISPRSLCRGAHDNPGTIVVETDTIAGREIVPGDPVLGEGDGQGPSGLSDFPRRHVHGTTHPRRV